MGDTAITQSKQSQYPQSRLRGLKPFKAGQSGNPKGRPKGSSIKDRVRQILENDPAEMDKFVLHFVRKNRELAWQMLEGKPRQKSDLDINREGLSEMTAFLRAMATPK